MPLRTEQAYIVNPNPEGSKTTPMVLGYYMQRSWNLSPRVNGRLKLQSNAFSETTKRNYGAKVIGERDTNPPILGVNISTLAEVTRAQTTADNRALASFTGRLRKGSASMGVTLATYSQSRDMVVKRSKQLYNLIDKLEVREKSFVGKYGQLVVIKPKDLSKSKDPSVYALDSSNLYLEGIFGWAPLLGDIYAAINTVAQQGDTPAAQRGSATVYGEYDRTTVANPKARDRIKFQARTTVGATVTISNPNLWLASRMGLINPAIVAWDLVPFSFVLNMFVNINQILGATSDLAGLTLSNVSTTRHLLAQGYSERDLTYWDGTQYRTSFGQSTWTTHDKSRTLGAMVTPRLQARFPQMNMSLAATATALCVQRLKTIQKVYSAITPLKGK